MPWIIHLGLIVYAFGLCSIVSAGMMLFHAFLEDIEREEFNAGWDSVQSKVERVTAQ